jgi:autotransporter-associated beta strand protein
MTQPTTNAVANYALSVNQLLHPNGVTAYLYPIINVTLSPVIDLSATTPSAYSDCSGWVNYVLDSLAPIHEAEVNAEKTIGYFNQGNVAAYDSKTGLPTSIPDNEIIQPWSRADVLQYFFGNDAGGTNGFQQITNFGSLQAGDLIAYSTGIYSNLGTGSAAGSNPTLAATGDTGHTMVVVGAPTVLAASGVGGTGLSPNAVTIYQVPVVDDSSVPHLNDDRSYVVPTNSPNLPSFVSPSLLIGGGVGTGTLSFAADANGNILQLRFNTGDPWFPNNLNPTNGSNAAISFSAARLTPNITLSSQLTVNMFPNALATIGGVDYSTSEVIDGSGGLVIRGGGVLTLGGSNSYTGGTTIMDGSTLSLQSAAAAGSGSITFASGNATLIIGGVAPTNTIGGLVQGDLLDFATMTYAVGKTTASVVGNLLTVSNGTQSQSLTLASDSSGSGFALSSGVGGVLTATVTCFASGTRISTERGEVAVESLRVGDRLATLIASGLQTIRWIGHRRVDCRRHASPASVLPIRVAAGAFGEGLPARALLLSPDHAVYVDGVLIPVKYLVNDSSIVQLRRAQVTYYHVELDRHDVIIAEGLPVESYLDTGNRLSFDNGAGVFALHADFASAKWEAAGCAELVVTGPRLAAVRQRLANRITDTARRSMAA